ncbi:Transglutaminase elicitor protein, partial [Globisporangium splendens]
MVASPKFLIAFTALAASALLGDVHATSLESNPVTPGETVALGHLHPAFAGWVPATVVAPIIKENRDLPDEATIKNVAPVDATLLVNSTAPHTANITLGVDLDNDGIDDAVDDYIATVLPGTVNAAARRLRQQEGSSNDIAKLETHFKTKMETRIKKLPTKGVFLPSPWPSSYWPIYEDGINYVWDKGQPSASEKYAKAYGLNVNQFTEAVSKSNGVLSQVTRKQCTTTADCASLNDSSACGKRAGQNTGYCIPTWFGICHAWSPAAILEPEPRCAVTQNGITFQPLDIKALVTDIYDGANIETVFTGVRYNGGNDAKDRWGRHVDPAYRDLGPGFFHIAVTNILGRFKKSFIVDVTAGAEVWNQPVRGFQVKEQKRFKPKDAAKTFYATNAYPFNNKASSIVYVKMRMSWIVEALEDGPLVDTGRVDAYTTGADYTYLLELDSKDNIIGGEWLWASNDNHPDFLWFPKSTPSLNTVTKTGLSYKNVKDLVTRSNKCQK